MITRLQALKLQFLCLKINGLEEKKQELTGALPTVFYEFAGHVAKLSIRVYENGWSRHNITDKEFSLYTDVDNRRGHTFESCKAYLENLYKTRCCGEVST